MPSGRMRDGIANWLAALPMSANSGDIYAVRTGLTRD